MTARGRDLAERCFALARSTTFAGERETAVARGTAIAAKAGLSLDLFDIPGRARDRTRRDNETFDDVYQSGRYHRDGAFDWTAYQDDLERSLQPGERFVRRAEAAPAHYTAADVHAAMAALKAAMARQAAAAGAGDDETIYDARRRNFDQAAAKARARDERRSSMEEIWNSVAQDMAARWDDAMRDAVVGTGEA